MFTMLSGTRYFQAKFISRSTRIRGRVALIQNIRKMNPATLAKKAESRIALTRNNEVQVISVGSVENSRNGNGVPPPRKRAVPRQLTPKTLRYSARKNRPNRMLEYSV